ncbi:hypothetical protein [Methylocapsa acidiphila]|uniref:hypothetical protein n=1 Tax=Methylocapsa acidiphila TaxID=133552 RepID=UPI000478EF42|nr:hypothetical protein [Methylocapsa acidiphila]
MRSSSGVSQQQGCLRLAGTIRVNPTGTTNFGAPQLDGYSQPGGNRTQTPAQLDVGGSYLTFAGAKAPTQSGSGVSAPADHLTAVGLAATDPIALSADPSIVDWASFNNDINALRLAESAR